MRVSHLSCNLSIFLNGKSFCVGSSFLLLCLISLKKTNQRMLFMTTPTSLFRGDIGETFYELFWLKLVHTSGLFVQIQLFAPPVGSTFVITRTTTSPSWHKNARKSRQKARGIVSDFRKGAIIKPN